MLKWMQLNSSTAVQWGFLQCCDKQVLWQCVMWRSQNAMHQLYYNTQQQSAMHSRWSFGLEKKQPIAATTNCSKYYKNHKSSTNRSQPASPQCKPVSVSETAARRSGSGSACSSPDRGLFSCCMQTSCLLVLPFSPHHPKPAYTAYTVLH